ncbi:MAG TPA: hypothetical protein PKA06_11860 [Gemmatales bacterium]|nr:hypothetical protein [Gemmatales bacterium]
MATVSYLDLQPGQRVKITQTVRVGSQSWPHTVQGTVRAVKTLVTGLATQRNTDDIVTVATVHFMKDNQELSSIAVDERTQIELL